MTFEPDTETFIIKEAPTEKLYEILKLWEPMVGTQNTTRDKFMRLKVGAVKVTLRERGEKI